jgi:hypothetical protein
LLHRRTSQTKLAGEKSMPLASLKSSRRPVRLSTLATAVSSLKKPMGKYTSSKNKNHGNSMA